MSIFGIYLKHPNESISNSARRKFKRIGPKTGGRARRRYNRGSSSNMFGDFI